MQATDLILELEKALETTSLVELAEALGISSATLNNWKRRDDDITAKQVASALKKSRNQAVTHAHFHSIKPIVEFFSIDWTQTGNTWKIFPTKNEWNKGLKKELESTQGIYIFYDSQGQALYVGKTKSQSLWKEINLAYNRDRGEVQQITRVDYDHAEDAEFSPAYDQPAKLKPIHVQLHEMASYFSAYKVADEMIDDIEALLIRGFANNLLNKKIERFTHARS